MSYYDLGRHGRDVCTTPEAQTWFDRGFVWCYGFNHEEAVACFRRALEADPACAMAHWGIGWATGPNYNMPWALYDERGRGRALKIAHAAAQNALAHARPGVEAALAAALMCRYPQPVPADEDSMKGWDRDFADAMRAVAADHPDDLDIACVFADALLNLTPWKMWRLDTGEPGPHTPEAQAVLEAALARPSGMDHPGLTHLYVHLMEMSPTPEKALRAADALRTVAPDAGHLVHMPTHIDVLCGHYEATLRWNEAAIAADRKWYNQNGAMDFYTGYRLHNYHFAIYGAMFLGRFEPAMRAVRDMAATTPEDMLRIPSPPMADFFEAYLSMEPHVLIRFGMWDEIVALDYPADHDLYCTQVAMIDYAKGVALAALGRIADAEAQRDRFHASAARVPETRLLHNNPVWKLLAIGRDMLDGELEYRKGNFDLAFDHLRAAIRQEDALHYDEPWGWMQPVRHALGALLLEQGRAAEAEATFREDLGLGGALPRACVHPDNVWALRGLHDCLVARGDTAELPLIAQRLALAEARTDRPVAAACGCAGMGLPATPCCGDG